MHLQIFLGFAPHLRRRCLCELKAFSTHFRRSPYQTLQVFYKRCGAYDQDMRVTSKIFLLRTPDTKFAQDYLGGDLLRLRQRVQALKMTKTLIVNSGNDTIVPPVLTNDNFGSECLDNLFLMEEGRHMVGFFAAKEIALRIERFVICL